LIRADHSKEIAYWKICNCNSVQGGIHPSREQHMHYPPKY